MHGRLRDDGEPAERMGGWSGFRSMIGCTGDVVPLLAGAGAAYCSLVWERLWRVIDDVSDGGWLTVSVSWRGRRVVCRKHWLVWGYIAGNL